MKFSLPKGFLTFILLAFCAHHAAADDTANVLSNGDFAKGKANWSGDVKDASESDMTDISASMDNQGKTSGMILTLKPHDWTKVSQVFNTRENALVFAMKYQTSADFAENIPSMSGQAYFESNLSVLLGIPLQEQGGRPPGMGGGMNGGMNNGMGMNMGGDKRPFVGIVIADLAQNTVFSRFVPFSPDPNTPQHAGIIFQHLEAHEEKTFYAFFPPGTGTITFYSLSLIKLMVGNPADNSDRPMVPGAIAPTPPNQ